MKEVSKDDEREKMDEEMVSRKRKESFLIFLSDLKIIRIKNDNKSWKLFKRVSTFELNPQALSGNRTPAARS